MNLDENGDEVVYEKYSKLDPGTPSFTTTELKNQTGRLLEIAMREPIELTSHGRPKVFMVPVGLMRKFLTLEDHEDLRIMAEAEEEGFLTVEESEEFLKGLLNAPDRDGKAPSSQLAKPAGKRAAANRQKTAPGRRKSARS